MSKHFANRRGPQSETPEARTELSGGSVPPRPSAIVRTQPREPIPSRALASPELPKPPATPRLSQWLRFGESRAASDVAPTTGLRLGWAFAFLLAGFGGGFLVAWLVGLV
jgi:hypothetical protein